MYLSSESSPWPAFRVEISVSRHIRTAMLKSSDRQDQTAPDVERIQLQSSELRYERWLR